MDPTAAPVCLADLRVLVVDDEADIRLGLTRLLESLDIRARSAGDGVDALAAFEDSDWDLVLTDLMMPRLGGVELLEQIKKDHPDTAVVLLTGFGTVQTAVKCLQLGAAHFLTKPFDNQEVLGIIRRLGSQMLAQRRPQPLGVRMVAEDPATRRMLELVRQVAPRKVPVLIEGESGAGKEVVARALHRWGALPDSEYLAVNCAALSDTLLESELFGHRKGAFTGADRDRDGIFAQAQGGTVFLDEVSSMSPAFQGQLLRVLQEKVVRQVGGNQDLKVNFRLIAATNRDLEQMVREGRFREDLYFRLQVVRVHVPALRQRPKDVLPLALHFLLRASADSMGEAGPLPEFSSEAVQRMAEYRWPGNVRELENAVQRALIVCCGNRILPYHLGLDDPGWHQEEQSAGDGGDYAAAKRQTLERFQREFVQRALEKSHGNVSQAALSCGLTRAAFQKILRQLNIDRESFCRD